MDSAECSLDIKKIIFDMDGVVTSERGYWNCAAMTVYEKIFEELSVKWCEENIEALSEEIFLNDTTIVTLKNLGVNSNIDLAYLVYLTALIGISEGKEDDELWQFVGEYFENIMTTAPELYEYVANEAAEIYNYELEYVRRYGELWQNIFDIFQHWYLGDEQYKERYNKDIPGLFGKSGFICEEEPIVPIISLKAVLNELKDKGYILGIATGRDYYETSIPLKKWGVWELFDRDSIATFDRVFDAEKEINNELQLAKPHPYVFLKSAYPECKDVYDIINKKNEDNKNILVVGDAGADVIAAKAGNMSFAAVLTGVDGKNAYDYFSGMNADVILNSVLELVDYL